MEAFTNMVLQSVEFTVLADDDSVVVLHVPLSGPNCEAGECQSCNAFLQFFVRHYDVFQNFVQTCSPLDEQPANLRTLGNAKRVAEVIVGQLSQQGECNCVNCQSARGFNDGFEAVQRDVAGLRAIMPATNEQPAARATVPGAFGRGISDDDAGTNAGGRDAAGPPVRRATPPQRAEAAIELARRVSDVLLGGLMNTINIVVQFFRQRGFLRG